MKIITALLLTFSLAACAGSSDDKKSTGGENKEKMRNVTDYSLCSAGGIATSPEGRWETSQASDHFNMDMTFQIQNGSVTLTNECRLNERSLTASVTLTARYNASSIQILGTEQNDHEEINEPDFKLSCDAGLKPMQMNYSFKGSCLVLSQPGNSEVMTLVPRY